MLGITVAEGRVDLGWVNVRWDHGDGNSYRVGAHGKYDLMVVPDGTRRKKRRLETAGIFSSGYEWLIMVHNG